MALTYADASAAIRAGSFDLAIMDINLGSGHTSLPLAEVLADQGVPVIFTSGYNSSTTDETSRFGPRIEKPFDEIVLEKAVLAATGRPAAVAAVVEAPA